MNKKIIKRLNEHYDEALKYFEPNQIVGVFYYGSANYGLDTPYSDVDSKVIVVPTWEDLAFNHKPVSTTYHMPDNDECLDCKDIREYFKQFRKQSCNFLEILFTEYKILNSIYRPIWYNLEKYNEEIAHYDTKTALATMVGMASQKEHALSHPYPTKLTILEKFNYDPKQLHHILRLEELMDRYMAGVPYGDCLKSQKADFLKKVKLGEYYNFEAAQKVAKDTVERMKIKANDFIPTFDANRTYVDSIINIAQEAIMRAAIKLELED